MFTRTILITIVYLFALLTLLNIVLETGLGIKHSAELMTGEFQAKQSCKRIESLKTAGDYAEFNKLNETCKQHAS